MKLVQYKYTYVTIEDRQRMLKLLRLLLLLMLMLKLLLMLEFVMAKVESWCVGCRCLLKDGEYKYMVTPVASGESSSGGNQGRRVLLREILGQECVYSTSCGFYSSVQCTQIQVEWGYWAEQSNNVVARLRIYLHWSKFCLQWFGTC